MSATCAVNRRTFLKTAAAGACSAAGLAGLARGAETAPAGQPQTAGRWQIGCFTRPWDQFDYRVALDAIAEAGYGYAGLMTCKRERGNLVISVDTDLDEARAIGQEVAKRNLKVPSVYGGDFRVGQSLKAGIDGLRKLIDNCAAAGAATLMLGGTGNPRLFDDYYKAVAECCDYAAEKRVGLVLKPHGGMNATGPDCRKTIERVGHKSFTLWYDPGNIFYYSDGKLDPVDDAPSVAGLVTGMCVKDFRMTTAEGKPVKEVMLTPGTGRVDFPRVVAELKRGGLVGGPLVVECLTRGGQASLVAEARKARLFVERLLA
jgi:sugar phosphate isomerase/epimerase